MSIGVRWEHRGRGVADDLADALRRKPLHLIVVVVNDLRRLSDGAVRQSPVGGEPDGGVQLADDMFTRGDDGG